jgi:hypothetical protein
MLTILVEQLLDPIRRRYGAPILVTSGYRCPALNPAVGGVANSHHIVGCAADIVGETPSNLPLYGEALQTSLPNNLCEHSEGAPHRGGAVQRTEGVCRGGSFNLALFHLIIQMQREGAIRFTQLIAEKDYRWLHISYVPGMLRNQIIDVNACASERDASSLAIAQRTQPSVCDEVTNDDINVLGRAKCFAIDVNDNVNQPSARQEGDIVALLSEAKASAVVNAKRSTRSRTDAPSASASSLKKDEAKESTLTNDTS